LDKLHHISIKLKIWIPYIYEGNFWNLSTKSELLQWRRAKVVEMRARGMSQIEIARELQVSKQSISADMQHLRSQAKESIKEYVTEYSPEQYQVCLIALDSIIRRAFDIIETSDDNREKLHAMELFKDTHLVKLELLSNATTIDSALSYIKSKQQEKHLSLDSTNDDDDSSDSNDNSQIATGRQTVF
jgi:IS30 family transposase